MPYLKRKEYEALLEPLTEELASMARWVAETKHRILIIFEGRDTAGKGGAITAVSDKLNPRQVRIVALAKPSERQASIQRAIIRLTLAIGLMLATSVPAHACRAYDPVRRLADLRRHAMFEGVVLVSITESRPLSWGTPNRPQPAWDAKGLTDRILAGAERSRTEYQFRPSPCERIEATPKRGDKWVLYLSRDYAGAVHVNASYSLGVALRLDPTLAARMHGRR